MCDRVVAKVSESVRDAAASPLVVADVGGQEVTSRYGGTDAVLVAYSGVAGAAPSIWVYTWSRSDSTIYTIQRWVGLDPLPASFQVLLQSAGIGGQ